MKTEYLNFKNVLSFDVHKKYNTFILFACCTLNNKICKANPHPGTNGYESNYRRHFDNKKKRKERHYRRNLFWPTLLTCFSYVTCPYYYLIILASTSNYTNTHIYYGFALIAYVFVFFLIRAYVFVCISVCGVWEQFFYIIIKVSDC